MSIVFSKSKMIFIGIIVLIWLHTSLHAQDEPVQQEKDKAQPLEFEVRFKKGLADQPLTGRVLVMLSQTKGFEPRKGPRFTNPEPIFARVIENWDEEKPVTIDTTHLGFPGRLKNLSKGKYSVQAVFDFATTQWHKVGESPGNLFSSSTEYELDPENSGKIEIEFDDVIPEKEFKETERVKLFEFESKILSDFHHHPIKLQAGVILPESYESDPNKRYGIVYEIPGFGGTHHSVFNVARANVTQLPLDKEVIWVVLNGMCRTGHHEFADSANNGPYGRALTMELIPRIEAQYRADGNSAHRFVTGHSSGGWSSLWLQITYPESFGGTWSTAPDPVDFRDFQKINIYKPRENAFHDSQAALRPIARANGKPIQFYKTESNMNRVVGRGGQLDSFDNVFSPRGKKGKFVPLWDRDSGSIDPQVAKHWEKYDIRMIMEKNWSTLGPKVQGKIHVFMGDEDTFYLDGATKLLKKSLQKLKSDAVVEIIPKRNHFNLVDKVLRERVAREMAEKLDRK